MAFQWLGADETMSPFPTVDVLRNADPRRRQAGRQETMDSYDSHVPCQTTLAGLPHLAADRTDLSPEERNNLARWLMSSRIRLIGRVTAVDTDQSNNKRTVAHIAGPQAPLYLVVTDAHRSPRTSGGLTCTRAIPAR